MNVIDRKPKRFSLGGMKTLSRTQQDTLKRLNDAEPNREGKYWWEWVILENGVIRLPKTWCGTAITRTLTAMAKKEVIKLVNEDVTYVYVKIV